MEDLLGHVSFHLVFHDNVLQHLPSRTVAPHESGYLSSQGLNNAFHKHSISDSSVIISFCRPYIGFKNGHSRSRFNMDFRVFAADGSTKRL